MCDPAGGRHKKKTARTPREGNAGRPTYWLPGVGEFASPFFFRRPSPNIHWRFGLRSSGFHPQMACGLLVHQYERCKSAESRISLLLCTPPRYCDVDGTRDWSRLSKLENDQFSAWRRQYMERLTDAQEAIFLSPDLNISNISTHENPSRTTDPQYSLLP